MEDSFDLLSIFRTHLKHIKLIIIGSVLMFILGYLFAATLIPKKYTSSVQLYVENRANNSDSLSSSDISVAQQLVDTCSIIFTSDSVIDKLSSDSNISYSSSALKSMISVGAVNNTEIMKITITCSNPDDAKYIATKMRDVCISEYERIISTGTITAVDTPKKNTTPSSPTPIKYGLLGFLIGLFITCLMIILKELFDTRVKPDDNLSEMYNIPVFAEIMDFENKNSVSYAYKYGKQ